ncbi:MAG: 50S ribosomal protein L25 [Alphaproteobacteria bacterium MarineAlpha5_Bin9]|nr:MAG: 50S ribosomal protein L25 [Alphaproteobacteria bacterium MarineAlpha5_Bin9]|tara:strand:+ start:8128 stop:8826 length:699 start_codon:yes stop_codon:yes gene_type:complete
MNTYKALNREDKISNKSLLKKGLVPGIVYGKKSEPKKIALEDKLLKKLLDEVGFYTKILNIDIEGKLFKVLPKEIQYHPVKDNVIHFDMLNVSEDTKVTVDVPVEFINQNICPGLKKGGVLNIVRRSVELICNANKIPEKLIADLEKSEIGDAIKISNISVEEGIKTTISDRDFVIATVAPPTVEVEEVKKEEATPSEDETKTEDKKDATPSDDKSKDQKQDPQPQSKEEKK